MQRMAQGYGIKKLPGCRYIRLMSGRIRGRHAARVAPRERKATQSASEKLTSKLILPISMTPIKTEIMGCGSVENPVVLRA